MPESPSDKGPVNPSTEDVMAMISPTKEPSTALVTVKDEPMEVSASESPRADKVGGHALETAPKDGQEERKGECVFGILAEADEVPRPFVLEQMDTTPESKPDHSHLHPLPDEKPHKASLDRLAEMAASPTHSSPRTMGASPREHPQPHTLPTMGDHSSIAPCTTLIPLTPKIGMGKPAITKRKFSPGRPRVKVGYRPLKVYAVSQGCTVDCFYL